MGNTRLSPKNPQEFSLKFPWGLKTGATCQTIMSRIANNANFSPSQFA